jgi:hypothetical protein
MLKCLPPITITQMSLERQRDSNTRMRQHVDQSVSGKSVHPILCEMADPRLTYAKPTRRLHLRSRSGLLHLA